MAFSFQDPVGPVNSVFSDRDHHLKRWKNFSRVITHPHSAAEGWETTRVVQDRPYGLCLGPAVLNVCWRLTDASSLSNKRGLQVKLCKIF